MEFGSHPTTIIESLLTEVQKPSRYVGLELGAAGKHWEASRVRMCFAFPETYEIGISHLGIEVLYRIANGIDGVLADRSYCPWPDMEEVMRRRSVPLWGIETRKPLRSFDLVGFSIQNELLATNLLTMLDLAGIPIRSADRGDEDPIVIAGGPCTGNPEPLAPFLDAACIGDGEELLRDIAELLLSSKGKRGGRRDILRSLAGIDGIYVPSLYHARQDDRGRLSILTPIEPRVPERVVRRFVATLDPSWIPEPPLVAAATPVQERLSLEISRGCTRGCRFCHAGFYQRPLRERSPSVLLEKALAGLRDTGYDELNLLSLSTADYSQLAPLMDDLARFLGPRRVALALPSMRVDAMSDEIARTILQVKKTGLTFAPEAGTQRLRNVINKSITDDDILRAAGHAFDRGWNLIKLYFMIGLPTEGEADIDGIVDLVQRLLRLPVGPGRGRQINVSVGAFVPKPHTPFQWEPFADRSVLENRLSRIKKGLARKRIRVKWQNLDASALEAALSRGDRRVGDVIEHAWRDGARFDSWTERLDPDRWRRAFAENDLSPERDTGSWDTEASLPWDVIDSGVTRAFLLRERTRAYEEALTEDCREGTCQGCGLPGAPDDLVTADPPAGDRPLPVTPPDPTEPRVRRILRIRFTVTGLARFLTHLERGAILKRALFRAGVQPVFTEGYSPRPRMSLGPPLPVGTASSVELADFTVGDPRPVDTNRERIAAGFPEGMDIVDAVLDFPECFMPLADIAIITYAFDFSRAPQGVWQDSCDAADRFRDAARVIITKEKRGKAREVDLTKAVSGFECSQTMPRTFRFSLFSNHPEGQNASTRDILEEVFGLSPSEYAEVLIVRIGYGGADGAPFPL